MKRGKRTGRGTKGTLVEGIDFKSIEVMDIGDRKVMINECGLSAIGDTETAILSDKDPKLDDFIMYRITTNNRGATTYLWQRAKILNVDDQLETQSDLKAVTLRFNPCEKNAFTQDVALGWGMEASKEKFGFESWIKKASHPLSSNFSRRKKKHC